MGHLNCPSCTFIDRITNQVGLMLPVGNKFKENMVRKLLLHIYITAYQIMGDVIKGLRL